MEGGGQEAWLEAVHLDAGGAEAGDLDDGGGAEVEAGGGGEIEEVDAGGGDVFAEVAGAEVKAERAEEIEEFGVKEVDLGEVGLGRVAALEIAVLDERAAVGVAVDAVTGEELDAGLGLLREGMGGVEAYGDDLGSELGSDWRSDWGSDWGVGWWSQEVAFEI